jgi:bacillithiol system protein YtxJ
MNWLIVSEEAQLEQLHARSFAEMPLLFFKHSSRCSVSRVAKDRLERNWKLSGLRMSPCYVDVLGSRAVSLKIAQFYGITHESPQVLVIHNGKCIYTAAHSGIEFSSLESIAGGASPAENNGLL